MTLFLTLGTALRGIGLAASPPHFGQMLPRYKGHSTTTTVACICLHLLASACICFIGCDRSIAALPFGEAQAAAQAKVLGFESSLYMFPFAGMAVFRPGGGEVVAVSKGFSRMVKNSFEKGESENIMGHYQGAGSLLVLSGNKEMQRVDPIMSTDAVNGPYGGFDCFHMPGVTAPYRTSQELELQAMRLGTSGLLTRRCGQRRNLSPQNCKI